MNVKKYLILIAGITIAVPVISNDYLKRQGKIAVYYENEDLIKQWKMDFTHFIREKLNIGNNLEEMCLLYAVHEGFGRRLVEALLKGVVTNSNWSFHGFTLLHAACDAKQDSFYFAQKFIEKGVSIYAEDDTGKRPFDYAAQNGNVELLQLLAEKDSMLINTPIKITDGRATHKRYALDYAVREGHLPAVQFLLKHSHAAYEPLVIERNKQEAHIRMYAIPDEEKKIAYQCILDELKLIKQRK